MAKNKSLLDFSGTLDKLTYVDSRAYGRHVRAARGTHKKAELNDALKASAHALNDANQFARVIKRAIDPYRENFYEGRLWVRLVSHFRKALKEHGAMSFNSLQDFELHSQFHLKSKFPATPEVSFQDQQNGVINIPAFPHPRFYVKYVDGYQLSVVTLSITTDHTCTTNAVQLPVIKFTDAPTAHTIPVKIPSETKTLVICIKLEASQQGKVTDNVRTKGMALVKVMDV